jgi:hypothetical protein
MTDGDKIESIQFYVAVMSLVDMEYKRKGAVLVSEFPRQISGQTGTEIVTVTSLEILSTNLPICHKNLHRAYVL